jgi:hypothetical protein
MYVYILANGSEVQIHKITRSVGILNNITENISVSLITTSTYFLITYPVLSNVGISLTTSQFCIYFHC